MNFKAVEEIIGAKFNDHKLLKQAFTHRSYINENRNSGLNHNERLEFLGDAVMELVVTDYLYTKFPQKNEGDLTSLRSAIVNTQTISEVANELGFNDHLFLSKGESKDTGRARSYILANTFESVVGALFVDQGYEQAEKFIHKFLVPKLQNIMSNGNWVDTKSKLQEIIQEDKRITPSYKTVKEEGPDHDKTFTVCVNFGEEEIGEGTGKSKQEAEQNAAHLVLIKNKWI